MLTPNIKPFWFLIVLFLLLPPLAAETGSISIENSASTVATDSTTTKTTTQDTSKSIPVVEGRISRALFTSSVQNHEPIDQLEILSPLISEAFYFTEFKNFQGQTLTHEWSHNGKVSHQVNFTVAGKRWRVHSSKVFNLGKKQHGTWVVKIRNAQGEVLYESRISYIRPSTTAEIENAKELEEAKKLAAAQKTTPSTDDSSAITKQTTASLEVATKHKTEISEQTVADNKLQSDTKTNNENQLSDVDKEILAAEKVAAKQIVENNAEDVEPQKPEATDVDKEINIQKPEIAEKTENKSATTQTQDIEKDEQTNEKVDSDTRPIWEKI